MENKNQSFVQNRYITPEDVQREQAAFMTQVYGWMSIALLITAVVSIYTASSEALLTMIFSNRLVFYGLLISEVLMVIGLSAAINRLSSSAATALFITYAAVNGLTMAVIFLIYTGSSIASTFFITAGTFGAMSAYGYMTKTDLSSWGNLLFMGIIGLIIASVVNIFLHSETIYWITSFVGVLIFTALTAYDTQRIKAMITLGLTPHEERKGAIIGALRLYLDFVNMFLYLLRFFGGRK
ncbi:Bax inhibitor-1/YccA family protein [Fibrella sp. HMF5335]|uniref:Bax inhibitor-1/YccA family protein n=1 Tax=Fibrella rubiginis TaxID=2817060 RepID=A0A939GHD0_9BACT|nr:Bax inhibitor-1/YccA family protein [Fibrella rubiginis]MBO0938356.1 Bax inhibitor-1/YccA family protein [Fibrella rubiginis]